MTDTKALSNCLIIIWVSHNEVIIMEADAKVALQRPGFKTKSKDANCRTLSNTHTLLTSGTILACVLWRSPVRLFRRASFCSMLQCLPAVLLALTSVLGGLGCWQSSLPTRFSWPTHHSAPFSCPQAYGCVKCFELCMSKSNHSLTGVDGSSTDSCSYEMILCTTKFRYLDVCSSWSM